jgi:hypothetical protein
MAEPSIKTRKISKAPERRERETELFVNHSQLNLSSYEELLRKPTNYYFELDVLLIAGDSVEQRQLCGCPGSYDCHSLFAWIHVNALCCVCLKSRSMAFDSSPTKRFSLRLAPNRPCMTLVITL